MPARPMPGSKTGLTVACAVLFLTGCAVLRRPAKPDLELREADHRFAKALAHYSQALIIEAERGPGSPEALEHFAQAAALDPKEHRLHAKVATEYFRQERPEEAVEELKKSCVENPDSLVARLALARGYQFSGNIDEALREYRKAQEMAPGLTTIHLTMANLYFHEQNDLAALEVLDQAYDALEEPEPVRAYCYSMALRFIQSKAVARAITCLKFVAERSSGDQAQLYHLIGELYEAQQDFPEAKKHYVMASEGQTPLAQSFVKLALLQLQDDPGEAIQTLIRGEHQIEDNLVILLALSQFYSTEARFQEAIETFERVEQLVEASEDHTLTVGFYLQYGSASEQAGLVEKAERIFAECLNAYPEAHPVLNYQAYLWAEAGRELDRALEYVKRALDLEPDNGAYLDTLGWIYYKQQDYANALTYIQQAHNVMKDDPTVTDHLGDVYQKLERRDRAIEYWTTSFGIDPSNASVAEKLSQAGVDVNALRLKMGVAGENAPQPGGTD